MSIPFLSLFMVVCQEMHKEMETQEIPVSSHTDAAGTDASLSEQKDAFTVSPSTYTDAFKAYE